MDIKSIVKNLHPLEVKILRHYGKDDELFVAKVESELGFKGGNGNQALSWLAAKGIIAEARRELAVVYELTSLGAAWHKDGLPEERVLRYIEENGGATLPELAAALNIAAKDCGSAFGALSKAGLVGMNADKEVRLASGVSTGYAPYVALKSLIARASQNADGVLRDAELNAAEKATMGGAAKKRGAQDAAFRIAERETVYFRFTEIFAELAAALEKAGITGEEEGQLTEEALKTGAWKNKSFRPYNVKVPPSRIISGRSNAYSAFLESVKDKLVSLGFEEFDGPLVETEFWNCDALFMP